MKTSALPVAIAVLSMSVGIHAASMAPPEVPAAVSVPAGHNAAMTLKGVGLLTYECRATAGAAGAYEWVFAGPDAALQDMRGTKVGRYYGGPTWEHNDGSRVTGKQLAVAPGGAGAIPLQLVQASPAMGTGAFTGVSYIQRVNTDGGVAPSVACDSSTAGARQTVSYSADYVFYKP